MLSHQLACTYSKRFSHQYRGIDCGCVFVSCTDFLSQVALGERYIHSRTSCDSALCCAELRRARLQFKKGQLSEQEYEKVINEYIKYSNDEQERIGLDVFVHGEPERTDM